MPGLLERNENFLLPNSMNTPNWRLVAVTLVWFVVVLPHLSPVAGSADESPAVTTSLSDDGRIGKIVDHQGTVTLRPALQQRWTPVARRMVLKPGDWLRTEVRGANAARVKLRDGTQITLGPGSLLELVSGAHVRVLRGEMRVQAAPQSKLDLSGPNDQRVAVVENQIYRVAEDSLVPLDHVPAWLQGFEGSVTQVSLGSLIANVDGRNVPLTIGEHKVNVEIRDQIARTTIEESFVNHTGATLEGVFYFPLPQDASISGFGMWIDGELIEADVVEKQRAREIYETILRERRDPGLLEWMGGNTFKARVFPIFGHAEKRIKLTYTQVLPRNGDRYHYSYSLQSEMFQQTPLRELAIDVRIDSTAPLRRVGCPTHAAARIEATEHAGHVKFTAQEFTPQSDFEVVVETEGRQSDLVVIPHRRGDDGYLMLQLAPPAADGNWQRETLADGEPLELLVLADTSASMDDASRRRQSEFMAALLASLSPADRFNVAVCDVACDWLFEQPATATDETLARVHAVLSERPSLGWTDLATAFESASQRAGGNTHVVYVGDGIVTARGETPNDYASRLRRLYADAGATFHAVSLSSRYETPVLQAIAAIGGGSVRGITGHVGPQAAARELLDEITRPGLRDMQIEFRGLTVASAYPNPLPNLSAGSQQIVLARYLPQADDQQGDVVVTGLLNGERVRYATRVSFRNAESGNSFIPRLWARQHLEHLLSQGVTPPVKDEIISLSQDYHIITPYTSLLVLESDADRQRFQVRRQFQMRDGERYFAEGRERANFELLSRQMKQAGESRLGLRDDVLRELSRLGRDVRSLQQNLDAEVVSARTVAPWSIVIPQHYGGSGGGFGGGYAMAASMDGGSSYAGGDTQQTLSELDDQAGEGRWDDELLWADDVEFAQAVDGGGEPSSEAASRPGIGRLQGGLGTESRWASVGGIRIGSVPNWRLPRRNQPALSAFQDYYALVGGGYPAGSEHIGWVQEIFPRLPNSTFPQAPGAQPTKWPEGAIALSTSLLRTRQFNRLAGGVEIVRTTYDVVRAEPLPAGQQLVLCSPNVWLERRDVDHVVNWCNERERGVLSRAYLLGRTHPSTTDELGSVPLGVNDDSIRPLHESFGAYDVELKPQDDASVLLVTGPQSSPTRILIDTERHVVLRKERFYNDRLQSTQTFGNFVNVGGMWWATSEVWTNHDTKHTARTDRTVKLHTPQSFQERVDAELAVREQTFLIREPSPTPAEAKRMVADGSAGFTEYLTLLLHAAMDQRWGRVDEMLAAAETLVGQDSGCRWVRYAILKASRRNEQLRMAWLAEAARLADRTAVEDIVLAEHILHTARQVLQPSESLKLTDRLKPVYSRQNPREPALKTWMLHRVTNLSRTGRAAEAFALQRQMARDYPHDDDVQNQFALALAAAGDYDAALDWLRKTMPQDPAEQADRANPLRESYKRLLREQGKFQELAEFLKPFTDISTIGMYGHPNAAAEYLSAFLTARPVDQGQALVREWLALADNERELDAPELAKLAAAVAFAQGHGFEMYRGRLDPAWIEPLAETCRALLRNEHHIRTAVQILSHRDFAASDTGQSLLQEIGSRWARDLDGLSTAKIAQFAPVLVQHATNIDAPVWTKIVADMRARWLRTEDADDQYSLGRALSTVYGKTANADDELDFLREQLARADESQRGTYAEQLFAALLRRDWSAQLEDEAFGLLHQLGRSSQFDGLSGEVSEEAALGSQIAALYAFTDRMMVARYEANLRGIEHPERLTRTELRRRQIGCLRAAREAFANRMRAELARRDSPLAEWMKIEAIYLDIRLQRNLAEAEQACWAVLGDEPTKWHAADTRHYAKLLFQRYLATAANLAVRRSAGPETAERLIAYLDRGIAHKDGSFAWKLAKYELVVALDRPAELERELRNWIRSDEFIRPWQITLANLLAEQGRLDDAIVLYEAIERDDQLMAAEYQILAGWYLALGRSDDYERAVRQTFASMAAQEISSWLTAWRGRPRSQRDEALVEITPEILAAWRAIFQKAERPADRLYELTGLYNQSRDFRLLQVLADAVMGQSSGNVYPFLERIAGELNGIQEEAAVDAMTERIETVRAGAETAADRRALDLLLFLAERRAAMLDNQPQQHVEAALAALRRSFEHAWAEGERRLAADFLAGLRTMDVPVLAAEQQRQLRELFRGDRPATLDRLHIAVRLAETLWEYSHRDSAVRLLELSIREFENSRAEAWPRSADFAIARYAAYLVQLGRFADAETLLQEQVANAANSEPRLRLMELLNGVYAEALRRGGTVTRGSGRELYEWLERNLREQLAVADDRQRLVLVTRLCSVYRAAHRKFDGVGDDLRAFALEPFNAVLHRQVDRADSLIGPLDSTIREVNGARDRLEFFLYQIEHEPANLRLRGRGIWEQHAFAIGEARTAAGPLGDLEPRLLKIVLAVLQHSLLTSDAAYGWMYSQSNRFWKEKEADFRQLAEQVYAEKTGSGLAVQRVAAYLYRGLGHHDRAIEMLLSAQQRGLLNETGQSTLVQYLHEQQRWQESIAILRPLIKTHRENIWYTGLLMRAYVRADRDRRLASLANAADKFFRGDGRWTEANMAALAAISAECGLFSRAAAYYRELIPRHERTRPNRGVGDDTLSRYYGQLAVVYSELKQTAEAVDAAASAIVAWGPDRRQRRQALDSLAAVLDRADDLESYIEYLDAMASETNQERPIIRQALGSVLAGQTRYREAVTQLKLAAELQPHDAETHNELIRCYIALGDADAAFQQLLRLAQVSRQDYTVYERLAELRASAVEAAEPGGNAAATPGADPFGGEADPFAARDAAKLAPLDAKTLERVVTSIVEVLPTEAASHQRLAEIRENQDRWNDAILHWKHVHRLRPLEPTGLLGLAKAQLHQRQWDAAHATIQQLEAHPWPERFRAVNAEISKLRRVLEPLGLN